MRVTLAYIDDWQGLYVDGILVLKGQNIEIEEIFQALEINFIVKEVDSGWMDEQEFKYPRVMNRIKFV